jgi:single-strand DNA-binding protein
MNDTQITLTGWLGEDVRFREAGGVPVADMRVACTPRHFDRKTEQWVSGDTQWYSVTAWRQLAENCTDSLKRGDPVVVSGRLSAETWTNSAGIAVTTMKVEATFIGHDLRLGVSRFVRNPRPEQAVASAVSEGEEAVTDEVHEEPVEQVSAAA